MGDLQSLGPLLLTVGAMGALVQFGGRESAGVRAACALINIAVVARYLWWRYAMSLPDPAGQNAAQFAWTWLFLLTETAAALTSMSLFAWMSRRRNRSAEADRGRHSPLLHAPVDVFIATYNEPYEILERTIVSATCIDHPDLRVWVLDDGARPWVRQLAEELGAHYAFRVRGKHAKAGNVNHGLAQALATGRRPEFLLLLDADFTANRAILQRTLGLFEADDVGIVQTPQHFFNPDPIQSGLLCTKLWPDEQRFFFNYILESKDAWGAAFCCGTSAVVRVAALEASGGMATETVTEDMLTSFKLLERGYRTIFLNEPLSMGLAPEGLLEYITQRSRWCLGGVQQIYTRWSFAGAARIGLVNRLSCLDAACYWMFTFPFKLMLIATPAVYWWTGTSVVSANPVDVAYWLAPSVAAGIAFMAIYGGNRVLPVLTDVSQLLSAVTVVRTVAVCIVKPWGHAFKVTAKGRGTDGVVVQLRIALPFLLIATATLLGILFNLSIYSARRVAPGYALNVFWSITSIAMLMLATHICVEPPRRRLDERFATAEAALVIASDGTTHACTVRDLSVGGARLECAAGLVAVDVGRLCFADDGVEMPFRTVRAVEGGLAVRFDDDPASRRRMIARLFTGRYYNEIERVALWRVIGAGARALLA